MAKKAVTRVVETFSNSDFFGVISFSFKAKRLGYNQMKRATRKVKDKVIEKPNFFKFAFRKLGSIHCKRDIRLYLLDIIPIQAEKVLSRE